MLRRLVIRAACVLNSVGGCWAVLALELAQAGGEGMDYEQAQPWVRWPGRRCWRALGNRSRLLVSCSAG